MSKVDESMEEKVPIEFVKAAPGAGLRESGKHAAHALVVEPFRAIHHNDVKSEGFAEIFGGLGFTCARRTLRAATSV